MTTQSTPKKTTDEATPVTRPIRGHDEHHKAYADRVAAHVERRNERIKDTAPGETLDYNTIVD